MIPDVLIGLGLGIVTGVVFFGGLQWTLSSLPRVRRPVLLASASFLVRSAFVVILFLVVSDGSLPRILSAMLAMLAVRTAMVAVARRSLDPAKETSWT